MPVICCPFTRFFFRQKLKENPFKKPYCFIEKKLAEECPKEQTAIFA